MHTSDGLNDEQRQAVAHRDGPLLIIAGAGTGKTKTLTHRIVHLIKSGVSAEHILAITFTNKAAKEMRERVYALLKNDPTLNRPISMFASGGSMPYMATFHALGVSILREFATEAGLKRHFAIYDRDDSMRVVKGIIVSLGYDPKQYEPRSVLSLISQTKSAGHTHEQLLANTHNPWKTFVGEVMHRYEMALKEEGALDFDDLLEKTVRLLQHNAGVREKLQERWTYIHIDEYQDTNAVQFSMAKLLTGTRHNICVVGDTDQLIYSWRGAQLENLLSFEKQFPGTQVVILEENYRSTQNILLAANTVIKKNKKRTEKQLFTKADSGDLISVGTAYSGEDEARTIAATISTLIADGVSPSAIAILYRMNFLSRVLEEACLRSDVPYQVLGTRFFERAEVKDVMSYLKASLNEDAPGDIARAVSTPPRGIGKSTLAKMLLHQEDTLSPALQKKVRDFKLLLDEIRRAAGTMRPSETIAFVIKRSGIEDALKQDGSEGEERLANVKELIALATKYDEMESLSGIEKLLDDAALATDQDSLEKHTNSVKLMTVHAAKGLEFEYVFIAGLEQGIFPHEKLNDDVDEEEERRLMYVAITRARKKLFLSYAMIRTVFGQQKVSVASEFIADIPPECLDINTEHVTERKVDLIDF